MGAFDHSICSREEVFDFMLVKSPPLARGGRRGTWGNTLIGTLSSSLQPHASASCSLIPFFASWAVVRPEGEGC